MKLNKEINGWFMVLAVLATAGVTAWVVLRYSPNHSWNSPYYLPPRQVAWNTSPGLTAANICTECHPIISTIPNTKATSSLPHDHRAICSNCHRLSNQNNSVLPVAMVGLVKGNTGASVVWVGSIPMHPDLGACTNCHKMVGDMGNQVPDIGATSIPPHDNRGNCGNCHRLANLSGLNANQGATQAAQVFAAKKTAPVNTATEGEWLGMEVAPITPITAGQYKIPEDILGLVVSEAEGLAALAGLKAGDVLLSVNGSLISDMTDFFQVTENGTLTTGSVQVLRQGQIMAVDIAQTNNPTPVATNNMPPPNLAGGVPAAMTTPRCNTLIFP